MTFLILWKIGKYEEAKRYVEINRKLIEVLLDEDPNRKRSESQLSVIMEHTHSAFAKQGTANQHNSRAVHESFDTGDSASNQATEIVTNTQRPSLIGKGDIDKILDSDSEDEEPTPSKPGVKAKPSKTLLSRLSHLSKLNLLGLIDLALIAA